MSITTPDDMRLDHATQAAAEKAAVARFDETGGQWGGGDCKRILCDWFPRLLVRARKGSNAKVSDYEDEIEEAIWILGALRDAFSANVDRGLCNSVQDRLWTWPSEWELRFPAEKWHQRHYRGSEKWYSDKTAPADSKLLASSIADYLERPWLQHNAIDGAAINAFLFSALSSAMDLYRMGAFGPSDWAYVFRKSGSRLHPFWNEFFGIALGWVVFPIIRWGMMPAIATSLIFTKHYAAAEIVFGLWMAYVIFRLATFRRRRSKKKGADRTLAAMRAAWEHSCGEAINPARLRELVVDAEQKGAIEYPPVLLTLIDRAVQRDATTMRTRWA